MSPPKKHRSASAREGAEEGPTVVGQYLLEGQVASGGMATIYYGRRKDDPPPGTTVAIKRVHPHLAKDPKFASMFIDEARLVSRIQHPNVVAMLDLIATEEECMLVMEYVHGESLARLLRQAHSVEQELRLDVVSAVVYGALQGLHASHDATNAAGIPLHMVHRDISPQNIMVGADGVARVLDFGVAKAAGSLHVTSAGEIKGKLAYMAPEQLGAQTLDRRTDVYAAGVVLWESITQRPLFDGESEAAIIASVLRQEILPPSTIIPGLPYGLDDVVLRALAHDREDRFASAREMALALEAVVPRATDAVVAAWVDELVGTELREREAMLASKGAAKAKVKVDASGATEVFFTTGGAHQRPKKPAGGGPGILQKALAPIEKQLSEMIDGLPEGARRPVHAVRWLIVTTIVALLVSLVFVGISPTRPPPEGSISGDGSH